ncbi:MAG: hypothetical protein J6Q48_06000 [Bacteroidaceae bacterium]|nr:hypothetical protein [Bacteroidaceae bacterium]
MFAKTIVLSDAFLDMPMSARCLYFTLSMLGDDDGFVNSPKGIMRQCGASEDDMRILLAKKFLLGFESGVIVIKHWRINNYLRNDRYQETKYVEEKSELLIDENGSYTFGIPCGIPGGIPRLGKDSIGNILCPISSDESDENDEKSQKNTQDDIENNFKIIYDSYPKRGGRAKGFDYYKGWLKGRSISGRKIKLSNKQMWSAIAKYKREIEEKGTELQYVKNFDTFMNKAILDYVEEEE